MGALLGDHHFAEQGAAIGRAFRGDGLEGRFDQGQPGGFDSGWREDRRGRIGAHAAGVRAFVAVECAFVILCAAEQDAGLAVAQGEQRRDLAFEEFLYDHACAGVAEASAQRVVDGSFGLGSRRCDDDALARRQPVGLDHERGGETVEERLGGRRLIEDAEAPRRQVVAQGESLGEGFGRLQPSSGAGRTETGHPSLGEGVRQPRRDRRLRSDHDQIGLDLKRERRQARHIVRLHWTDVPEPGHPGIARGANDMSHKHGLGDLPGQRMFAAARADDEDVHAPAMASSRRDRQGAAEAGIGT